MCFKIVVQCLTVCECLYLLCQSVVFFQFISFVKCIVPESILLLVSISVVFGFLKIFFALPFSLSVDALLCSSYTIWQHNILKTIVLVVQTKKPMFLIDVLPHKKDRHQPRPLQNNQHNNY